MRALLSAVIAAALCLPSIASPAPVRVGSKKFTESVVLGEVLLHLTRDEGLRAEHLREIGGTRVLWNALLAGEIDAYPEYTGTLRQELVPDAAPGAEGLAAALAAHGVLATAPLGFENTYAIGMKRSRAKELGLVRLSDLAGVPDLPLGFSNEFLERQDGWPALRSAYGLPQRPAGLDHDLAYRGLEAGEIAATDLYSTDAEIAFYDLLVLEDDRRIFPEYRALVLHRQDLDPAAARAFRRLEGRIDEAAMIGMNARAKLDRVPEGRVAADFLRTEFAIAATAEEESRGERLLHTTVEHLVLVGISLFAALLVALPLGIVAARRPRLGQWILATVGVLQTIPSLALLVVMIPLLGIGGPPAIAALFLYSLLPVVRNTHAGLTDIPADLRESALALGLSAGDRLRLIELPLAARSILAGVKTAAVINVGTATLGALVGAGGYGRPILTGIRLADTGLILEGAVPAAVLALVVQGGFDLLERRWVPGAGSG